MTKETLIAKIEDEKAMWTNSYHFDKLISWIRELDEPTPALLPFTWPYDNTKYDCVTRDGRDVVQLVKFDLKKGDPFRSVIYGELYAWEGNDGIYIADTGRTSEYDLFLSPVEPKMVEAWINYYDTETMAIYSSEYRADVSSASSRIGPAIRVAFPKPTKSDI